MIAPTPPSCGNATSCAAWTLRWQHALTPSGSREISVIAADDEPAYPSRTRSISAKPECFWVGSPLIARRVGPSSRERTAAIVWSVLARIDEPAVLWNIFPLHPHEPGDPFSNRCHTRAERDATWPLLIALIGMIRPRRIVAIGRDAGMALDGIDVPLHVVRHPSYGGQAEFIAGIHQIYGIAEHQVRAKTLELPL